jgi:hypothetical protein
LSLRRVLRNRLALSTVVTTLIILVISVLLASVVTYFAINVTSTRVQEESLALTKQHIWYDAPNSVAQAAIMVINAGGRDIVIDKITARGQECAWTKVFYTTTSNSISNDLFYNTTLTDGGSISVGSTSYVFKQATNDLTLQSGKTLIIYITNPDSISVNDIGLTVSINIFTSQAMYYKETNVQGAGLTTVSSSDGGNEATGEPNLVFSEMHAWIPYGGEVGMVVTNNGDASATVTGITVNGVAASASEMYGVAGSFTLNDNLLYIARGSYLPDGTPQPGLSQYGTTFEGNEMIVFEDLPSQQLTIPAGYTAILWVMYTSGLDTASLGQSITVSISIQGHTAASQTVEVEAVPMVWQ